MTHERLDECIAELEAAGDQLMEAGVLGEQWHTDTLAALRRLGELEAAPPWSRDDCGSVVRSDPEKRQVVLTFENDLGFKAMEELVYAGLIPVATQGAAP